MQIPFINHSEEKYQAKEIVNTEMIFRIDWIYTVNINYNSNCNTVKNSILIFLLYHKMVKKI